jgi:diguanylate cyclase (GGDEF)-like protein
MDMATDNLEEGIEVTPEAFQDLQNKLAKAEKKLAKAKSRAQATMQEIWQLDVKLKEEEERANQAEARLAELADSGAPSVEPSDSNDLLHQEIDALKADLEKARAEASGIEDLQAEVDDLKSQVSLLNEQLARGQAEPASHDGPEVAELQERILQLEGEKNSIQSELQVQIADLESALAEARKAATVQAADVDESVLQEAGERIAQLEAALAKARESVAEAEAAEQEALQDARDKIAGLENALADALDAPVDPSEPQSGEALEQAREKIAALEAQLQAGTLAAQPSDDARLELAEVRLNGLRIALHEAEERARTAEGKMTQVDGSASVFEEQLQAIQQKVREAEERALEWEEKFHRSEERADIAEQSATENSADDLVLEFQDRISELETELAEARQGDDFPAQDGGATSEEVESLRAQLTEAQSKLSELEGQSGVSIEAYQRLEKELNEFQAELEEANQRAEEAAQRAGALMEGDSDSAIAQYKERLDLADERAELLEQKARQAQEKHEMARENLAELQTEHERLKGQLSTAQESVAELTRRVQQEAGQAQEVGLSSAAVETKLKEALQRARDADLKANQAEIQLRKATESLNEYEQRANESDRETQRLAFQDSLTGLPNLNLIRQYLDFTVKQVQRYNRASALLVVDLDRFKLINDAMGFKAGDELLTKVAERLQTAIRESDALGRKGEDEFLILLSELITGDDNAPPEQKTNMIRQNIAIVVNRISECLSRPFHIQGQKFYIRASIGVSICPNDAESAQEMLEHADSAMYHAKESGRGRCVFYNNELHKRQERRLTMDSQLRLAMEKGEFVLQYQPIIEMTKGKGQIVGVEALLRWNHRIDGLLEPASFLSIAEETGLIVQLGQWVCRQSCWQLRQWLSQGHNLFISFNVSIRQMLQADLAEMILSSVDEFGLQPGLIFVEVSEGSNVEEVDLIERVVANLGRAGIRVAIDDFGVGYSSLSRIDLQHIQFLKVDPSLVNGCQQDRAKANICEAAVRLAQSLELRPLAEGVETLAQAKFLTKIGCQYMQGYHIQAPADAKVIEGLLNEKRAWKF